MEQTSITPEKPRALEASPVLAIHSQRRITDHETLRLIELERRGEKPLLSDRAYR